MYVVPRRIAFSRFVQPSFQDLRLLNFNNVAATFRQKSTAPETPNKQKDLLRYPAFPLKDTMDKFMKTVEPLLDAKELAQTKESARQFMENEGCKLQQLLERAAEKEDNWLANRWSRVAYFQYRSPVTVFSSPGMTFPLTTFKSQDDYLKYTSKVIFGILKYKELVDCDKIPIVKMGKLNLDNSQYGRVFGTCRIPKPKEDTIKYHPNSKHIVIIHKNHFYKMPVYDKGGKYLSPCTIEAELKKIMINVCGPGIPFGLLTTDNRDNWAESYEKLRSISGNDCSLDEIERSLFTVSLDNNIDVCPDQKYNVLAEQLIHGGGSCQNAGNRYMDKTIQLCVNPNGVNGFTYEHSPAEGQPIAVIVEYVMDNYESESFFDGGATSNYEPPELLKLQSNDCINDYISKAQKNVDQLARDLHMHVLIYKGYGKDYIKKCKLSPDSFVQMALQYAFYSLHGTPGAAYESAHLRIFKGGRTETIRSCSNESIAFAKAMCSKDPSAADLLRKAVEVHKKYSVDALMGRGVDRHLLGLKLMAVENNLPIPGFYKSPGYIKSAHFRLSTSQVASKYANFMCYGPLTDDGYGCCYNPRDSSIIVSIASWRFNDETCSDRFAKSLTQALDDMKAVMDSSPKSKL